MPPLHEVLFRSRLAAASSPAAMADIASVARLNNQALQLTGWLVFDGRSFAQLLEGDGAAVAAMVERIRRDARHGAMEVLHDAPLQRRRFRRFAVGYAAGGFQGGPAPLDAVQGDEAMRNFLALLPALEGGA